MTPAVIRPYRETDLDDLYRVCLQTGNVGADATSLYDDPRVLGHTVAAPYALFEPSLAFVAEDDLGMGGYIVGALDSKAFGLRLEADWWPALREQYPAPPADVPPAQWTRDQRSVGHIHNPLSSPGRITADYPSHLHINLVARLQSQGLGRRLMNTMIGALREQGSSGVHFFVTPTNERAIGFYRHLGFTELPAQGVVIFAMNLRK